MVQGTRAGALIAIHGRRFSRERRRTRHSPQQPFLADASFAALDGAW
jgi:hypothetical protein